MRILSLILLILLIAWIVLGAWLAWPFFCGIGAAGGGCATQGWHIHDGDQLDSNADAYVSFDKDSYDHQAFSSSLKRQLQQAASHLKNNSDRSLLITGFFDDDEKLEKERNKEEFKNMGLARADHMKDYLVSQGAPKDQIALAGKESQDYFWCDDQLAHGVDFNFRKRIAQTSNTGAAAASAAVASGAAIGTWAINDGSGLRLNSPNFVHFKTSDHVHITPRANGVDNNLKQTADYLKKSDNRSLNILGYYRSDEKNSSGVFSNLGLARANNVKQHLVNKLGVTSKQITTEGKLIDNKTWWQSNILKRGVDFTFSESKNDDARLADIKARLFGKPLTVYFATNQSAINLSSKERKDFSDLMYYLENVQGSKLEIGGHTDNVGDPGANKNLSQKRAKFVKDYFNRNGLSSRQMTAKGYGLEKPIASNNTSEGKAKNRRVEVILQ